ncbi:methyltransferase domain-containing protein, partial [Proteus mirabilis]|uniref:methyltransferase domain-containing protein n=1 Tax=Proteus mirabilis TaxID=584 RepID=UPI0025779593
LFCGSGGFGVHCAQKNTELTGIEISPEAIERARLSANELGLEHVEFLALDSTGFALAKESVPEFVLVNPPRRGLGETL